MADEQPKPPKQPPTRGEALAAAASELRNGQHANADTARAWMELADRLPPG